MKNFLNKIRKLQELERKINLLKFDELVTGKKNYYDAIIAEMKLVALSLKQDYNLDEFNFSSDEEFYQSVKNFLNKRV